MHRDEQRRFAAIAGDALREFGFSSGGIHDGP